MVWQCQDPGPVPHVDQMPPPPHPRVRMTGAGCIYPPGLLHSVKAQPLQQQDRAYLAAPGAGRISELSFGPTLPPEHSTSSPGSSSPVGRQMVQSSPRGQFLRKESPVVPLTLENKETSPQKPFYWGISLTQHIFHWQQKISLH